MNDDTNSNDSRLDTVDESKDEEEEEFDEIDTDNVNNYLRNNLNIDELVESLLDDIFSNNDSNTNFVNYYGSQRERDGETKEEHLYQIDTLINDFLFDSIYNSTLPDIINDPLEYILNQSFANQETLIRSNSNTLNFSSKKYVSIIKDDKDTMCSICLELFSDDDDIHEINICHHIFHLLCIHEWGRYKHNCPLCRNPLSRM